MSAQIPYDDDEFKLYVVSELSTHTKVLENIAKSVGRVQIVEDESKERDEELEDKLQATERKFAWISGAGSALGALLGFFFGNHR